MSLSMHQSSLPVFIHGLTNLSTIITKAAHHAEAKKIEDTVFTGARLFPDMFPLIKQVQIATDMVKFCAARLAGIEAPSFTDEETTFAQLQERIQRTIAFLETVSAPQIDGTEEKPIHLKVGGMELDFNGQDYVLYFVVPNFYFHLSATYAILRHNGVEVGKGDFLGKIQ